MKMILRSENDNIRVESLVLKDETLSKRIRRSSLSRRNQHWNSNTAPLLRLLFLALILIVCDMHPRSRYPRFVSAANNDDYYGDGAADDATAAAATDDANAAADGAADGAEEDGADESGSSQSASQGDDKFGFSTNGFGSVSVMPTSCITYNNGHMIKFDFFDSSSGQCRLNQIGSFVVSIAHYMRAYFNDRALALGDDFALPGDAGYLNCVMLQETAYAQTKLYAKIGCMDRETFTSTKLQIHVYTDSQCSMKFDDGESSKQHSSRGYEINGYYFSTRVSFRPPFYTCQSCVESEISDTFNKKNNNWYDDDYISEHGKKSGSSSSSSYYGGDAAAEEEAEVDEHDDYYGDDYFGDDTYMYANDDVYRGNRELRVLHAAPGQLEKFAKEFWSQVDQHRRSLYTNYYDVGDWSICQRIHKYGVWCDEECQSLDAFRVNEWSKADIILLSIMCTFMAAMMLLVVAKRLKAAQKAKLYGDDTYRPGIPPLAMALIFLVIIGIVFALAKFKFVNETLVFAIVTCILLFIYMLKLTLFESRRPVLLAAPRHEAFEAFDTFDNPLDDRLFT